METSAIQIYGLHSLFDFIQYNSTIPSILCSSLFYLTDLNPNSVQQSHRFCFSDSRGLAHPSSSRLFVDINVNVLDRLIELLDDPLLRVESAFTLSRHFSNILSPSHVALAHPAPPADAQCKNESDLRTFPPARPLTTRYFLPLRISSVTSPSCGDHREPVTKPPAS